MLIQGLLQKEPNNRIDLLELCLHPFWGDALVPLADTLDHGTTPSSRRGRSFLSSSDNVSSRTSYDIADVESHTHNTLTTTTTAAAVNNYYEQLNDTLTNNDAIDSITDEVVSHSEEHGVGLIDQNHDDDEKPPMTMTARPQSAPGGEFSDSIDMKYQQSLLTVGSSVQVKTTKEAWTNQEQQPGHGRQGTYKLERGSAVNDLTELSRLDDEEQQHKIKDEALYNKSKKNHQQKREKQKHAAANIKLSSVSSFGDERAPRLERAAVGITAVSTVSSTSSLGDLMPPLAGGPDVDILDHLYHPSDLTVSPIAENRQLVKLPTPKWDPNVIPAPTYTPEQLATAGVNRSGNEVKSHLKNLVAVYSNSGSQTSLADHQNNSTNATSKAMLRVKMHIIAYLMSTATRNEDFANSFLNENLVQCFLHDLKASSTSQDLKIRIGKSSAYFIRHSMLRSPYLLIFRIERVLLQDSYEDSSMKIILNIVFLHF